MLDHSESQNSFLNSWYFLKQEKRRIFRDLYTQFYQNFHDKNIFCWLSNKHDWYIYAFRPFWGYVNRFKLNVHVRERGRKNFVLSALYVGAVTSLPFLMMKVNVRQVSVGPSKRTTALFSAASLHLLGTSSRRTQVASCRVH